jgi:hypothetical protein
MSILDDIEAEVGKTTSVLDSIETLITNLVAAGQAAQGDPARQAAILATLQANNGRLSNLVLDNTPADPPGVPTPPPVEVPVDPNAPQVNPLRR